MGKANQGCLVVGQKGYVPYCTSTGQDQSYANRRATVPGPAAAWACRLLIGADRRTSHRLNTPQEEPGGERHMHAYRF